MPPQYLKRIRNIVFCCVSIRFVVQLYNKTLVAIVSSFAARIYGQRRAKRKTDVIVKALTEDTDDAPG